MGMAGEGAQLLTAGQVPDLDRAVVGGGEGQATVGTHRHRPHLPGVAGEGAQLLTAGQVPDLDRAVGEAERARRPSALTATEFTPWAWPARVRRS